MSQPLRQELREDAIDIEADAMLGKLQDAIGRVPMVWLEDWLREEHTAIYTSLLAYTRRHIDEWAVEYEELAAEAAYEESKLL